MKKNKEKSLNPTLFIIPKNSMTWEAARTATKEEIIVADNQRKSGAKIVPIMWVIVEAKFTITDMEIATSSQIKQAAKEIK